MDFRLISLIGYLYFSTLTFRAACEFEVWINVNPPAVKFGDSLVVTCNTTCPNSTINIEYKRGIQPNRTEDKNQIRDYFASIQKWDFTTPCSVQCPSQSNEKKERKEVVTVYNQELNISSYEVQETGKPYSLECIGPRVYPSNKLILTWLRGNKIIQNISKEEQGFPDNDKRLRNVFNFTASISDHQQTFTCLAQVDLGYTIMPIANSSIILETYYKPQNTVISVNNKTVSELPVLIKKSDEAIMACSSNGNPPVNIEWKDPRQGSKYETQPSGVLHISQIKSEHGGIYICRAKNQFGTDEKTVIISIKGVKDEKWKLVLLFAEIVFFLSVIFALFCCFTICKHSKSGSYKVREDLSVFSKIQDEEKIPLDE
ncbi:vascular cell adhesion protein 1-like isoform X2 [Pristis pectinata]|nr:vascular cell adhesion protein 1-like isoform X2 [Pristis pectinata]XP_051897868.1 vascular cell adhesion protein 1-like isoform X2 [Pristis pectinata]XP_051897869.1 vascular cell adhesion protein 1-like isoform X2 [Pristis pectinata]XP_051897870.1 vascular cell adhesion protein 1-like isoform X2 [Pristis pectinata]XP_051897871.1 vascular cell adhesion protein 1-like isoform X2 [Pristis pectinata]